MELDPPRLKTPQTDRSIFTKVPRSRALVNGEDGSIWEPDHSRHGGEQWKRWPDRRAWEAASAPTSVWPDGRVRK